MRYAISEATLRIKDIIDKSDLTYWNIADEFGISDAAVSYWFNSKIPPQRCVKLSRLIETLIGEKITPEEMRPDIFLENDDE